MKKILFVIILACANIMYANAQTRVIVGAPPVHRVVVVRRPAVVVAPVRRIVVRPAVPAVVVRPVIRRRIVVVHP